jgi:hypothetical protein
MARLRGLGTLKIFNDREISACTTAPQASTLLRAPGYDPLSGIYI